MIDSTNADVSAIPVTVVAGFLGAGKTTLLNKVLTDAADRRFAVLVNDFGELDIDRSLIAEVTEDVQALTNGCICCSIQSDLMGQLGRLAGRQPPPEQILIECSGVSDPGRIARTLGYPEVRSRVRLDATVTVVDPAMLASLDDGAVPIARAQIAQADLIVVNWRDGRANEASRHGMSEWLPGEKRRIETTTGGVPLAVLLEPASPAGRRAAEAGQPVGHPAFVTATLELAGEFRYRTLRKLLAEQIPSTIYRIKGLVRLAERPDTAFWLQWVGGRAELYAASSAASPESSRLVIIGRTYDFDAEQLRAILSDALVEPGGTS